MEEKFNNNIIPKKGGEHKRSRKNYEEEESRNRRFSNKNQEGLNNTTTNRSSLSIPKAKKLIQYLLEEFRENHLQSSSGLSPVSSDREFTDFSIHCLKEMKFFYLHKCILSIHSPFFERMFKDEFEEKNKSTMEIKQNDITTADEMELLLHYMYFAAGGRFCQILLNFFRQQLAEPNNPVDPDLMIHRDFLLILDKLLDLGDFYVVGGIKLMVENDVLSDQEVFFRCVLVYEPYLLFSLINKHNLRRNSRTFCFISSSILSKLSPHVVIKHGTNNHNQFAIIKANERNRIDETLEDLISNPDLTKDLLSNFGLVQGLNGVDMVACINKLEKLVEQLSLCPVGGGGGMEWNDMITTSKLTSELKVILSILTKMKKLMNPEIGDIFAECWRDPSDLRDWVISQGKRTEFGK